MSSVAPQPTFTPVPSSAPDVPSVAPQPSSAPVPAGSSPVTFLPSLPPPSSYLSPPSPAPSSGVGIGIGVTVLVLLVFAVCCVFMWRKRKRRMAVLEEGLVTSKHSQSSPAAAPPPSNTDEYEAAPFMPPGRLVGSSGGTPQLLDSSLLLVPRSFSYEQLRIATKNFSDSELLGGGGFGLVYRGMLADDGTLVAVKCIAENSSQGEREFKAEVTIIGDLRHRNLVKLRGWCHEEGKFLLVYDYMPNGSLDYLLFNDTLCSKLSWNKRYSIASGIGSALQYLHEGCDNVIIHRDIKTSNVLLDESFNAKLGDFGLAREVDQGMTAYTATIMAGTRGYMAPECLLGYGKATRETDVYAFGTVLLELVCGKRAIDVSLRQHEGMLLDWVWHLYSQGKVMEAVDERLTGQYDNEEARRMLVVGLFCSHPDSKARPKIKRALEALLGTVALPLVPSSKPTLTFGTPPPISISQISSDSSQVHTTTTYTSSNPRSNSSSEYIRHVL